MGFNVEMMSEEEISVLLDKITKIPDWQLKNTQTAREARRLQRNNQFIQELQQSKQWHIQKVNKAKAKVPNYIHHHKISLKKDKSDDLEL